MQSDQDFTIRPADVRDAAGIGFVHCRGWQAAYAGLLPETILQGMSPEKSAARFRQEGCRDTLVAEQNGRVVGFCGYGGWRDDPDPDEGEIIGLYVLPELQRQGIGAALMKAALAELAARGCRAVSLWVLQGNDRAARFYERQGFARTGQTKGRPPFVEFRMRQPWPGRAD